MFPARGVSLNEQVKSYLRRHSFLSSAALLTKYFTFGGLVPSNRIDKSTPQVKLPVRSIIDVRDNKNSGLFELIKVVAIGGHSFFTKSNTFEERFAAVELS